MTSREIGKRLSTEVFERIAKVFLNRHKGLKELCFWGGHIEKWLVCETYMNLSENWGKLINKIDPASYGEFTMWCEARFSNAKNGRGSKCDLYIGPPNGNNGADAGYWFEFKHILAADFRDGMNSLKKDMEKFQRNSIAEGHGFFVVLWMWHVTTDKIENPGRNCTDLEAMIASAKKEISKTLRRKNLRDLTTTFKEYTYKANRYDEERKAHLGLSIIPW